MTPPPPLSDDLPRWLVVARTPRGRRYLAIVNRGWTSMGTEQEGLLMTRAEADRVAGDPGLALTWSDLRVELPHDVLLAEHAALTERARAAEADRDELRAAVEQSRRAADEMGRDLKVALTRCDDLRREKEAAETALRQAQAERDAAVETLRLHTGDCCECGNGPMDGMSRASAEVCWDCGERMKADLAAAREREARLVAWLRSPAAIDDLTLTVQSEAGLPVDADGDDRAGEVVTAVLDRIVAIFIGSPSDEALCVYCGADYHRSADCLAAPGAVESPAPTPTTREEA